MIMEVYMSPKSIEDFKNYKPVFVFTHVVSDNDLKMHMDLTQVKISNTKHTYGFTVQRYSPSEINDVRGL